MHGQGLTPHDYHGLANGLSETDLIAMLQNMERVKRSPLAQVPSHDEFLKQVCDADLSALTD